MRDSKSNSKVGLHFREAKHRRAPSHYQEASNQQWAKRAFVETGREIGKRELKDKIKEQLYRLTERMKDDRGDR